jgi:hypothetical protein
MAMYAMIASTAQDHGFLTPLYHIASLLTSPTAMEESMAAGMAGTSIHVAAGAAVIGLVIHMMTGAMYGIPLAGLTARLRPSFTATAGIGAAYGVLVFAMSSFVGLPVAARIFGAGDPIANMAEMAGWTTFFVEHVLFGLTLGLLLGRRAARR